MYGHLSSSGRVSNVGNTKNSKRDYRYRGNEFCGSGIIRFIVFISQWKSKYEYLWILVFISRSSECNLERVVRIGVDMQKVYEFWNMEESKNKYKQIISSLWNLNERHLN